MSDKFKDAAGPFTCISHILAKEVGIITAAVYGSVWGFCQMGEGCCRASLYKIGGPLGINRATVMRSINKLCELGYLEDTTPTRRNAPHTYIIGKSVAGCNSVDDKTVDMRNSLEGETVAYSNSDIRSVAQRNATVAESHLNRVFNRKESTTATRDGAATKLEQFFLVNNNKKTTLAADEINAILNTYPPDDILYAISEAVKNNAYTLSYVDSICKRRLSGQPDKAKGHNNGTNKRTHSIKEPAGGGPPPGIDTATWDKLNGGKTPA